MSKSLTKTFIIGRLGMDPELRQGNKTVFTRFSLADTSSFKNGQQQVQWHSICAFGKQAQYIHKNLHKGDLCCIEGHLNASPYEKNGERRINNSIIAEDITFLSSKRRTNEPRPSEPAAESFVDAPF